MTPAANYADEELVQLLMEVYGRSMAYPDSRAMHERWVECRDALVARLAARRERPVMRDWLLFMGGVLIGIVSLGLGLRWLA